MYTKAQIEDAIILALAPLKYDYAGGVPGDPAVYATVREIRSYQGDLETIQAALAVIDVLPAIFVFYTGSEYAEHGSRKIERMKFLVYICDQNLRVEDDAARRGGTENPGVYAMLEGVRDLLFSRQLSLEIYPLQLNSESAEAFGEGIAVYSAEYETAQALLYPPAA